MNTLLIDFGSTFTKVTAVDRQKAEIIGRAQDFTTVDTDIQIGLNNALEKMGARLEDFSEFYACSSAAGGLKMMVSGLVPDLTAKAARMAALGAGAKVVHTFSHELIEEDLEEIKRIKPDIFLLCGGTDGGNRSCIEHNAKMLATLQPQFPIIYAGNRAAQATCKEQLKEWDVSICKNIMPTLDTLEIEEVQKVIRNCFIRRIVEAKGLSTVNQLLGSIAMPTPSAVLQALHLFSKGTKNIPGMGELVAVDLGGATTDVYSIAKGAPSQNNVIYKGIKEPEEKRTVEGDLGMRYSMHGIVEAVGLDEIVERSGLSEEEIIDMLTILDEDKSIVPKDERWKALDFALASSAVSVAVGRHAGMWEEVYTPVGLQYAQTGKDLRDVPNMVVTGGALLQSNRLDDLLSYSYYDPMNPYHLRPQVKDLWVDQHYILSAMGVLADHDPDVAMEIMKKEILNVKH